MAADPEVFSLGTQSVENGDGGHVQFEMLVEAAARGAAATSGRHAAGAAVAAAIRTIWGLAAPEPVERDVVAMLGLVRPSLSCLVRGERAPGAQRALRHCALHADLGRGVEALPRAGIDAKRRQRGGRRGRGDATPGGAPAMAVVGEIGGGRGGVAGVVLKAEYG